MMLLKHLAEVGPDNLVSTREISDKFKIPFDPTAKVMQKLNASNILTSTIGKKGGYRLNKNLSKISYMKLIEVIEGKQMGRTCETAKGKCDIYHFCNIIPTVENLNSKINQFLTKLSLEELLMDSHE